MRHIAGNMLGVLLALAQPLFAAAGGAREADCLEMTYCDHGWTVDVFMQAKEGNHWHEYHCGWKTRAEAEAAGKLACNAERMKELTECAAVQIYNPEARPQIEN